MSSALTSSGISVFLTVSLQDFHCPRALKSKTKSKTVPSVGGRESNLLFKMAGSGCLGDFPINISRIRTSNLWRSSRFKRPPKDQDVLNTNAAWIHERRYFFSLRLTMASERPETNSSSMCLNSELGIIVRRERHLILTKSMTGGVIQLKSFSISCSCPRFHRYSGVSFKAGSLNHR